MFGDKVIIIAGHSVNHNGNIGMTLETIRVAKLSALVRMS